MSDPAVRHESPYVPLTQDEFRRRFLEKFYDPAFEDVAQELERVFEKAWDAYIHYRKSPRHRAAGDSFADPTVQLPLEWLDTRARVAEAEAHQKNPRSPSRVLIVNGSPRSEHSCPAEISKTHRLAQAAQSAIESVAGFEVDVLDLSTLTDEPWKVIHPCKACVSTSMPLCHWPCSCYPNHALGQTNDWMAEIYPRWAAAHGIFILCPVHWYQAPSCLKLMIDRLVCADGGNPDPTTTRGKNAALAKAIELRGWGYPKHLAGRAFAIATHGDAAGPETLRRLLAEWLTDMGLVQAGASGVLDAWIGYLRPYATSHEDLDKDPDTFTRVRNAAMSLTELVAQIRSGRYQPPDRGLEEPKRK